MSARPSIRALSIRTLAAGFTVVAILLCLTISFVIALAFPAQPPARVTIAEVHAVLRGEVDAGWGRRLVAEPSFHAARQGQALVAQAGLAAMLDAPVAEVRVRPLAPERALEGDRSEPSRAPSERLRRLLAGMALSPGMSFAPFEAAVRQADGRWLVVTPPSSWLTPKGCVWDWPS